jgi:hypothetical protein
MGVVLHWPVAGGGGQPPVRVGAVGLEVGVEQGDGTQRSSLSARCFGAGAWQVVRGRSSPAGAGFRSRTNDASS